MKNKYLIGAGSSALLASMVFAGVAAAAPLTATPWTYDPDSTGTAVAAWVPISTTTTPTLPVNKDDCKKGGWQTMGGLFKNQGDCVSTYEHNLKSGTSTVSHEYALSLQKNGPTATNSAAGASINGLATTTLTELGFDYKNGTYCGAGAPRYNVYTTAGTYYFFGCTYGTHTDLGTGWTRVRFTNADAFPADGVTAFPGFGTTTVTGIEVVQDEGGQALIDNLDINGMIIGNP